MAILSPPTKVSVLRFLIRQQKRLRAEFNRVSAEGRNKLKEGAHNTIGNHEADCSSNAPSIVLSHRLPNIKEKLRLLTETIQQVEENSEYGTCEDCGNEIPIARLQLMPSTTQCIACGVEAEERDKKLGIKRRNNLVFI